MTKEDLIKDLRRNSDYYLAGPDREAGDLLKRAADMLAAWTAPMSFEDVEREVRRRVEASKMAAAMAELII
jgi:hypothetical protein